MKAAAGLVLTILPWPSRGDAVLDSPFCQLTPRQCLHYAEHHPQNNNRTPSSSLFWWVDPALSARFKAERTPVDRHVVRRAVASAAAAAAVARGDPQRRWPEWERRAEEEEEAMAVAPDGATDGAPPARDDAAARRALPRCFSAAAPRVEGRWYAPPNGAPLEARAAADEFYAALGGRTCRKLMAHDPRFKRDAARACRGGGGGGARAGAAAPPAIEALWWPTNCRLASARALAAAGALANRSVALVGDSLMRQLHLALACVAADASLGLELLGDGDAPARGRGRGGRGADAARDRAMPDGLLPATRAAREALARCLLYTSPSPRDGLLSRMPSSA